MTTTQTFVPRLDDLRQELEALLFGDEQGIVVALKGGWGEGKTWFWKEEIAKKREKNVPGYVSVFGAKSLESIQEKCLAESFRTHERVGGDLQQWLSKGTDVLLKTTSIATKALSNRLGVPDAFAAVPELLERFSYRPGWVLCLDDIERLPRSVGLQALFGFVSSLRDEYRVNVILIYNDQRLANSRALQRYSEKVIDREIVFVRDVEGLMGLAFKEQFDEPFAAELARKCHILGLKNIRILRRFERYYREVMTALGPGISAAYRQNLVSSLLLFCWSKFAPDESKDLTLDFLSEFSGSWAFDHDESKEEQDWRAKRLRDYRYTTTDELDKLLIKFVRESLLDRAAVRTAYQEYLDGQDRKNASSRVEQAWQVHFHGTLANSEAQFCDELFASTMAGVHLLSLSTIDSALRYLDDFGRTNEVSALLAKLADHPPEFARVEDEWPRLEHPGLRALADRVRGDTTTDTRPIEVVIESAIEEDFLREHDRKRLAQFGPQDYLNYLLSHPRPHLTSIMRHLFTATNVQGRDEFDSKVNQDLKTVITSLAKTNRINHLRMKAMGLLPPNFDPAS